MKKQKMEHLFLAALIFFCLGFIAFLWFSQWPQWWKWIIFEQTPMTWLESVLLVLTALMAFLCFMVDHWQNQKKTATVWFLLGAGFLMLALDERFALHERIRDGFLGPRNIQLPWTGAGDIVLLGVMAAGLLLLPKFLRLFSLHPSGKKVFLTGVFLAGISVLMDSFDVHQLSLPTQRWLQFVEELLETSAQICFFSGIFLTWTAKIRKKLSS